jgi:hypothetical protein
MLRLKRNGAYSGENGQEEQSRINPDSHKIYGIGEIDDTKKGMFKPSSRFPLLKNRT